MMHNPGRYTLSQTEFCLVFKKGKIPTPRGARNVRQLISIPRGAHSEKPEAVIAGITKMFPKQKKIELFARKNYWGLEIPEAKISIPTNKDIKNGTNPLEIITANTCFSNQHSDSDYADLDNKIACDLITEQNNETQINLF